MPESAFLRAFAAGFLFAISACVPEAMPASMPADFSLRFEGGVCNGDAFDTEARSYARELAQGEWANVYVALTDAQRADLYAMVAAANLTSYPSDFVPKSDVRQIPTPLRRITVRLEGRAHTIRWEDQGSTISSAVRLRAFIRDVYAFFNVLPNVSALPQPKVGCL